MSIITLLLVGVLIAIILPFGNSTNSTGNECSDKLKKPIPETEVAAGTFSSNTEIHLAYKNDGVSGFSCGEDYVYKLNELTGKIFK